MQLLFGFLERGRKVNCCTYEVEKCVETSMKETRDDRASCKLHILKEGRASIREYIITLACYISGAPQAFGTVLAPFAIPQCSTLVFRRIWNLRTPKSSISGELHETYHVQGSGVVGLVAESARSD